MPPTDRLIVHLSEQLGLDAEHARQLMTGAWRTTLARGEHWVEVGGQPRHLALVLSGMMQHYCPTGGGEATRWVAPAGTFAAPRLGWIRAQCLA